MAEAASGSQAGKGPGVPKSAGAPSGANRAVNGGGMTPQAGLSPTTSQDIHRTLPHSEDAEKALLGSILLASKEVLPECVERIGPPGAGAFHSPAHEHLYAVLVSLWDAKKPIDFVTLGQTLSDSGTLETIGGAPYLNHLLQFVPTAINAQYYLGIVREKQILRQIIAACSDCARRAYSDGEDTSQLLDEVESRILAIGEGRVSTVFPTMEELMMEAVVTLEQMFARRGEITGLATGFKRLDEMTMGLQSGEMFVIAARPSMGKTALAMNFVENVALKSNVPVAVFSLEMSTRQLIQRLLCSHARVNIRSLSTGFAGEREFEKLTSSASALAKSRIFIDDSAGLSILDLRAKARRLKSQHDIGLVMIDYLQLLRSSSRRAQDNRQLEIAEISSGIKGLAKELDIPVVVLAQLNRKPDERQGQPRLSDLRESGSIEQDADVVTLLTRKDYYKDDKEEDPDVAGKAELIIAKNRNGPSGETIALTFLKEYTRFESAAPEPGSNGA